MDLQKFKEETVKLLGDSPLGHFMEITVEDNYEHPEIGDMTRFVVKFPIYISRSAINSRVLEDTDKPEKVIKLIERFIEKMFREDFLAKEARRAQELREKVS